MAVLRGGGVNLAFSPNIFCNPTKRNPFNQVHRTDTETPLSWNRHCITVDFLNKSWATHLCFSLDAEATQGSVVFVLQLTALKQSDIQLRSADTNVAEKNHALVYMCKRLMSDDRPANLPQSTDVLFPKKAGYSPLHYVCLRHGRMSATCIGKDKKTPI